jgi:hypothetical protein
MAKIVKNKVIEKLKTLYSKTGLIEINYQGSGDSFDGFYDTKAYLGCKNKTLKEFSKEVPVSPELDKISKDLNNENSFLSSVVFDAFEKHSDVDFNNEGCSGIVYIDLEQNKIWIENTYYFTESITSADFIYCDNEGIGDARTSFKDDED